jgi:hypothetical protein
MTLLPKDNDLTEVQAEKTQGNQLFPVFLKLNNLHTVLVGGGNVGLEKLTALLQNSPAATVTIISKIFCQICIYWLASIPQVNISSKIIR